METPSTRILVVEDFEPFRRFICSTLKERPDLQIIGETKDGLEAVQMAEQLQPDLVLLDIGLPSLNGIDAARRIRKLSPKSKIVMVSQESSADVVQEALALGAFGYVVKVHAGSELLAAVDTVLLGGQFVSSGLSGRDFISKPDLETIASPAEPLPPLARQMESRRNHKVEFYSDDEAFVTGFTRFIEAALVAGNPVIVVATEPHRKSILQRLQENRVDIVTAVEEGRYISLDVVDKLSTFMVNDRLDHAASMKVIGDLIDEAAKASKVERSRVAACGECAPTLWKQGNADAALEFEHLCDEIAKSGKVDILCGYILNSFQRDQERHFYERVCAKHSSVSSS